ncbi:MAG: hypothetical protein ACOY3U_02780 [Bacillota bacterium]
MKTFLKHRTKQEFINFVRESFAKLPSMGAQGDKIQCSLPPAAADTPPAPAPAPPATAPTPL